jgi:16S rRNA (cytosine967-C5)-methyltransferase
VSAAPARVCAYAVLRRVFERDSYADRALQAESRRLDARDRALAMRLAYGAIQRRLTLDHLIERLAERPPDRLDAAVLASLRLGLYELLYLRGAPDRAVVADAVELAKSARSGGHGLVNAVLRRAAREGAGALLGDLDEQTPEDAAVMHSHPPWLARMWWEQLGPERARALMTANNEPGEFALRANPLRCAEATGLSEQSQTAPPRELATRDPVARELAARDLLAGELDELGVRAHVDRELPEALVLDSPLDLHATAAWRQGRAIAQSRAAMLVARVLDPAPGERVLDLCAAPGGKSTHLAALMRGDGEVVAVERNPARARELRATVARLGAGGCVRVEVGDAATPRPAGQSFDRVLVDPPCSGLGTLQAHPDLRWRWPIEDPTDRGSVPERLAQMVAIQRAILAAGAAAVRPGGTLVYSTCTISVLENERQMEQFLSKDSGFELEDLTSQWPSHPDPAHPRYLQTLPDRDRTAGFFIARMRRIATPKRGRL